MQCKPFEPRTPHVPLRVALNLERAVEKKVEAQGGREGVKARNLVPKYCTEEKKAKLIDRLTEQGLWSWDADWPGDKEDCSFQAFPTTFHA